ncbi:unnamed protein product [Pleuronectes platessa]|uniref:dipeptidase E n=1 Tax=Pleuronectes platessa TaxID=8262 RepID=A0A9N7UJM9_PLEPL|nr:unnamed protein product [Pleuronectes platessa]
MKRRLLLVSNSTLHGGGYLGHCQDNISDFFGKVNFSSSLPSEDRKSVDEGQDVKSVLFVPYALHDRDAYTRTARDKFQTLGYELESIHEASDPVEAVRKAEGFFIGGGNTFRLLKSLYDNQVVSEIRRRVMEDGVPYMGSSAGTNVATVSISTTNDMPIVFPPSFSAIGLVPFNINPHYLEPDPGSRHMGETREQRITQYHEEPDTPQVLGLREGSMLLVEGNRATLLGTTKAKLFSRGRPSVEYDLGSDLSFLLTDGGPPPST